MVKTFRKYLKQFIINQSTKFIERLDFDVWLVDFMHLS